MRNNGESMRFRTLALLLALGCGLGMAAQAKTKTVRRSAAIHQVKRSRNKAFKARKVKPAVRRPKKNRRAR